jgi:hypothetical protein
MCCAEHNNLSSEISFFDWFVYFSSVFYATSPSWELEGKLKKFHQGRVGGRACGVEVSTENGCRSTGD